MNELVLDRCFYEALSKSADFRQWLLGKTKFVALNVELVVVEEKKWHQTWYKDPETKKDSETDIMLIFCDVNSMRYALHIENKPDHRTWEPNQVENYEKRARYRMKKWNYIEFQTVLLAPVSFLERHKAEAAQFDVLLSYEEVGDFVPEFKVAAQKADSLRE